MIFYGGESGKLYMLQLLRQVILWKFIK